MSHMRSSFVAANGIDLHVLDWEPSSVNGETVVLLHGFMDAASSWDVTATILKDAGYTVFAPDLRGFGRSGRVPLGGYYHFPDYVADLAHWTERALEGRPFHLVGHSMGGTIATLFAASHPERVNKLALLEGLGPPETPDELTPLRMKRWLADLGKHRARSAERPMTQDEAFARLKSNHPRVPDEILRARLRALLTSVDDGLVWAFDPLHRTTSPMPYRSAMYRAFVTEVASPVLFVSGGILGYHPPDEEERLSAFKSLERFELPEAGHMMHWTEPHKLAARLITFFGRH